MLWNRSCPAVSQSSSSTLGRKATFKKMWSMFEIEMIGHRNLNADTTLAIQLCHTTQPYNRIIIQLKLIKASFMTVCSNCHIYYGNRNNKC